MHLNFPSFAAALSLSVAKPAMAEDLRLPENGEAKIAITEGLKTPKATELRVDAMTKGTYRNVAFVLAHATPSEASLPNSWQYELDVVERIVGNPPVKDDLNCPDEEAYRKIDSKPLERFLEPGSTFRVSDERRPKGERKTILIDPPAGISAVLWLNPNLPASCFVPAGSWNVSLIEENPQVCFVPISGTAK